MSQLVYVAVPALEMPKSPSLTVPPVQQNTLVHFRSRWMMPCASQDLSGPGIDPAAHPESQDLFEISILKQTWGVAR